MTADVRPIRAEPKAEPTPEPKTAAETALAATFASAKARLPGGREVAERREAAFLRFEASGLPSRRVEEWKYTDLRALMRDAKPLAAPAAAKPAALADALPGIDVVRVAIVNGVYAPAWSDTPSGGVTVTELFAWLAAHPDYLRDQAPEQGDIALALNAAFASGGVVVEINKGATAAKPIHLAHVFTGTAAAAMYPRSLVLVEPGAHATVIETWDGPAGLDYQINAALTVAVGDGANLARVKIGRDGAAALHVATTIATIGATADYNEHTFTTGSAVTRNQLFLRCGGDRSRVRIAGASLLKDRQHVDSTLAIVHAARGCESREVFKSVLDGESRGVFQGKIAGRGPQAQKDPMAA